METKICRRCEIEKPISEFYKNRSKKDGYTSWCKKCISGYSEKYRNNHKEEAKEYRLKNSVKIKEHQAKSSKEYRLKNLKKLKEYSRKYYFENLDKFKKYRNNHKKEIRKWQNEWQNKKRANDPVYRLNVNISRDINRSLRGDKNGRHWEGLVGYTCQDLKEHIEKQFKDEMNWENYGKNGWEIDHRIPLSIFNITGIKSKGFKKAWALENLQPLWATDNRGKRNKLFVS